MNRATADNQSVQSKEGRLEPAKGWVKALIDGICAAGVVRSRMCVRSKRKINANERRQIVAADACAKDA